MAKRCPGRSRLCQRHCSKADPGSCDRDVVLQDKPTDSCGSQGMGLTVLASQDPWGILCRTGAKGQWREMD